MLIGKLLWYCYIFWWISVGILLYLNKTCVKVVQWEHYHVINNTRNNIPFISHIHRLYSVILRNTSRMLQKMTKKWNILNILASCGKKYAREEIFAKWTLKNCVFRGIFRKSSVWYEFSGRNFRELNKLQRSFA